MWTARVVDRHSPYNPPVPVDSNWQIPEHDLYLFNHGKLARAWKWLGAHADEEGTRFAVWAPHAKEVGVAGEWNGWKGHRSPLTKRDPHGVWEGYLPGVGKGAAYKYELIDSHGHLRLKSDPFGFRMEMRPKTASIVWPLGGYEWGDDSWMRGRDAPGPMRIYEVHLGAWRKGRGYAQLADELVAYVVEQGFTHLEFLPVAEHPYDPKPSDCPSWSLQGFH